MLIFLSTLWLSRFIVVRWVCTWDKTTSRCPTLVGVLSHWMNSHVMTGQWFDRANPQLVAKIAGGQHGDDSRTAPTVTISTFFLPSLIYTWQFVKLWVWHPFFNMLDYLWGLLSPQSRANADITGALVSRRARARSAITHPYLTSAYSYWYTVWNAIGLPLNMFIPLAVFIFYLRHVNARTNQHPDMSSKCVINTSMPT